MIKTILRNINLREYSECLNGNTMILHKGIKIFKKRIQRKCDSAFMDISERLQDELKQSTSLVYKMFIKYRRSEIKLNSFILGYQVLKVQRNDDTIKHLKTFGFTYSDKKTHELNLRLLAGQIDRLKSVTGMHEKDYLTVMSDAENKDTVSIEEIIIMLNKAMGFPAINLDSSLSEFAAANLTAQKLNKK